MIKIIYSYSCIHFHAFVNSQRRILLICINLSCERTTVSKVIMQQKQGLSSQGSNPCKSKQQTTNEVSLHHHPKLSVEQQSDRCFAFPQQTIWPKWLLILSSFQVSLYKLYLQGQWVSADLCGGYRADVVAITALQRSTNGVCEKWRRKRNLCCWWCHAWLSVFQCGFLRGLDLLAFGKH